MIPLFKTSFSLENSFRFQRQQQGIASMIITLRHVSALFVTAAVTMAGSAFAQGPSEAQRAAVKAQCRSDYMAHCSSVTPGGKEALECLAQHMSSLSSGCQEAVKAVEAAVAPKEEPKQEAAPATAAAPATEAAKPAAESAAKEGAKPAEGAPKAAAAAAGKKPSSAQIAAVKSNCRSDYMKVCSSVTPGGPAALQCLEKNEARLSPSCKKAVAAATGGSGAAPAAASGFAPATANAAPDATPPAAGAAPAAAPLVLRPMRPIEVLGVMRSACGADVRSLCAGVPVGGGRIISCLVEQSASLSPACREVLGQFAAQ
jgi:hypothetical protein